jgi:hypothetical protein
MEAQACVKALDGGWNAAGMDQEVEHLLSKHKVLSNPISWDKERKRETKKKMK